MLTKQRFKIAAEIIDNRGFKTQANDDEDTQWAQAFIFDEGIFFLGDEGMQVIKKALIDEFDNAKE